MARAWGIKCKNKAQSEALEALMNPEIDLVIINSKAGSGKTFISLAAGLEQVVENKLYKDIIFTRAPVSVGDDMGFLPGEIENKMLPWCYGVLDNLEALGIEHADVAKYLKFTAMQHLRGRSFQKRFLLVDELQNISKEQIKVILTRAGEGCKVVCLGDNTQLDNKKLTKENNALQYLVDRAGDCPFIKVLTLPEGVRSRLCDWASEEL